MIRTNIRTFAATTAFVISLYVPGAGLCQNQQPGEAYIAPASAANSKAATPNWTQEQLLTSTVHNAWLLSGRDEATFFEMVKSLAELSAKNRGIELPETAAAGRRMGDTIKRTARADTDQLLYAVVDKAVLATAKAPVHVAGKAR